MLSATLSCHPIRLYIHISKASYPCVGITKTLLELHYPLKIIWVKTGINHITCCLHTEWYYNWYSRGQQSLNTLKWFSRTTTTTTTANFSRTALAFIITGWLVNIKYINMIRQFRINSNTAILASKMK